MDANKNMVELSFGRVPLDREILRSITVGLDKVSSSSKKSISIPISPMVAARLSLSRERRVRGRVTY